MAGNRISIEIDWDNLYLGVRERFPEGRPDVQALLDRARREGRVVGARAYADWFREPMTAVGRALYRRGVEPVYAPGRDDETGHLTKNAADVHLAVSSVERYLAPGESSPDTVVLVTGDADLAPLVGLLRRCGARVIVSAVEGTLGAALRAVADEVWIWETEVQPGLRAASPPAAVQGDRMWRQAGAASVDLWVRLEETVIQIVDGNSGSCLLSKLPAELESRGFNCKTQLPPGVGLKQALHNVVTLYGRLALDGDNGRDAVRRASYAAAAEPPNGGDAITDAAIDRVLGLALGADAPG